MEKAINTTRNTERKSEYIAIVNAMPTATKAQIERKANAERYLANAENDNGVFGRIDELLNASERSTKRRVGSAGQNDGYIYAEKNGKTVRVKAESKENGGRVGNVKSPYIVYKMDVCNAGTSYIRRVVEPRLYKWETFKAMLIECNAIKSTNGRNPEPAIQVTSKKLYEMLPLYGLPYDAEHIYTENELATL